MSDDATARLGLPYLAAGQMQKHVTVNEALTRLDALVQPVVVSRSIAAQPATPNDGDLYILPASATGLAWAAWSPGDLVRAESGGWQRVAAPTGLIVKIADEDRVVLREDGEWIALGRRLGEVQSLSRLGLNTDADAANPFAAKVNTALWTARETGDGGTGDMRLTLNKQGVSDVLSLLFQSGYGGRAELGLIGDDDFRLKVSDGGDWHGALSVDGSNGRVLFAQGAVRAETTVLTTDATYAVPDWARVIEAVCVGGGGAGGAGAFGAAGTARFGGGGGAAGGISSARWLVADLPGSLVVDIGAGGAGITASDGQSGEASTVTAAGTVLLSALGGHGGHRGDAVSGVGGAGGLGTLIGNAGGSSSLIATAQSGQADTRPDGGGGGGGGGGLDTANVARAGGAGGVGAVLGCTAVGGSAAPGAGGGAGGNAPAAALHWAGGGGGGGAAAVGAGGLSGGSAGQRGAGGGGGGAGLSVGGIGGGGSGGVLWLTAIG